MKPAFKYTRTAAAPQRGIANGRDERWRIAAPLVQW